MKVIGLLGGMSWESSAEYYRLLNEEVRRRLGGLHSAECLLYSVDFAGFEQLQHEDRWDEIAERLADRAQGLESAGAGLVLLCTNTMHLVADRLQAAIGIPFLHIAQAAGTAIRARGLHRVGLLGTRFTMEKDFYSGILSRDFGIETLVPGEPERAEIHRIIYDELCLGTLSQASKAGLLKIIDSLRTKGAEGIVLGCTELPLLIKQEDVPLPVFDTLRLHVLAGVETALS